MKVLYRSRPVDDFTSPLKTLALNPSLRAPQFGFIAHGASAAMGIGIVKHIRKYIPDVFCFHGDEGC